MARDPGRENLEIRAMWTGKGWRVDAHLIGALQTRRVGWYSNQETALAAAKRVADAARNLDYYGFVRVMVEII